VVDALVTVQRQDYRLAVRAVDAACHLFDRLGLGLGSLDVDSILATAQRRVGLDDWGDDAFLTPMRRVAAHAERAGFSHLARVVVRQILVTAVTNRLRIEDWMRRHPEAADFPVKRPVFILGFPRTGTTLLQNLLSLDDGARALRFWEIQQPVPVSEDPGADRAQRLRSARRVLRAAYFIAPEMATVHQIGPETAEECWPLFGNTFSVLNWDIAAGLQDYGRWLLQSDMVGPYREYRRQLQMLGHFCSTRQFILKCPEHLWFIDALLDVFPDAAIVWTHRDPFDCVASYCSLISMNRRMLYGRIDGPALGQHIQESFAQGVERAMRARDRHPQADFYDIPFHDVVSDPLGSVRKLKAALDIPHDADGDARGQAWLSNGRKDKKGAHRYDAERYGLEAESLYRRFAEYIDRFQIPLHHR